MNLIVRLLLNALSVYIVARLMGGVHIDHYATAIVVAIVLSVLNLLVKPLLVVLTLPITIATLGLFMLIINAAIILLANALVNGFSVDGVWTAVFFSIWLSLLQSLLHARLGSS